jgi:hypothetical protein
MSVGDALIDIKNAFIASFTNSDSFTPIVSAGLELVIQELINLGMSKEDIDSNMNTILNRVNEEIKKYVAESADKIHSCKNCNIETTEFRCGKCQKAYYCSKECQVENWKTHRLACKQFCKQKK